MGVAHTYCYEEIKDMLCMHKFQESVAPDSLATNWLPGSVGCGESKTCSSTPKGSCAWLVGLISATNVARDNFNLVIVLSRMIAIVLFVVSCSVFQPQVTSYLITRGV